MNEDDSKYLGRRPLARNLGRPRKRQFYSEVAFVSFTVIPSPDDPGITHGTVGTGFLQERSERRGIISAQITQLLVSDKYSDCVRVMGVRPFRSE
jgi:hypothetical protein